MTNQPTNAVATNGKKPAFTIRQHLESDQFKAAVAKALPKHLTPDRFIRVACTTVMRTPKLAQCDQTSFLNAVLTLSQLGIEADGRRAHLIPFENRKRGVTECQLIIDYKGLAELAMRSGVVSCLHADVICENDEFEYDAGQLKRHRINFKQPRGAVYAVYALCRFKDGAEKCDVMTREDVEDIRKRSRAGNNGPWVTDWNEMAKKTVFRRLSKWLPLSPEFRDAVDADEEELPTAVDTSKPASLVEVATFELPPAQDNEPEAQIEDDGDIAPTRAAEPEPLPEEHKTPQVQLMEEFKAAGCSFDVAQRWGEQSGSIPDASSLAGFRDVPTKVAEVVLKAFRGTKSRPLILAQLEQAKGELV